MCFQPLDAVDGTRLGIDDVLYQTAGSIFELARRPNGVGFNFFEYQSIGLWQRRRVRPVKGLFDRRSCQQVRGLQHAVDCTGKEIVVQVVGPATAGQKTVAGCVGGDGKFLYRPRCLETVGRLAGLRG